MVIKYVVRKIAVVCLMLLFSEGQAQDSKCLPDKEVLIPFRINDKWGYSDRDGKIIIPVQYDAAGHFGFNEEKKPLAKVKIGRHYHLIDKMGQVVKDSITEDEKALIKNALILYMLERQSRGISIQLHSKFANGKYGFRIKNDTIIPPVFSDFGFHDEDVLALKSDKWILFNTKGDTLSKYKYDSIFNFNGQSVGIFKRDGKYGLINRLGHEVVEPKYLDMYQFFGYENLIVARGKKKKYGLIDQNGIVVEEFKYTKIEKYYFSEFRLFKVYLNKKQFGFINCEGKRYFK